MGFVPLFPSGKQNGIVKPRPIAAVRQAAAGGNASADIAIGDAVGIDANGNAFRAGPNDIVRGIVIGFRMVASSLVMNSNGPISDDYSVNGAANDVALVCEDANVQFMVQADTFAQIDVGGKFNLADAAPDPLYSQSRQTINIGGGAGTQFQAEDLLLSTADNSYGANARVVARLLQTFNN